MHGIEVSPLILLRLLLKVHSMNQLFETIFKRSIKEVEKFKSL